jgi:hypothetical protein
MRLTRRQLAIVGIWALVCLLGFAWLDSSHWVDKNLCLPPRQPGVVPDAPNYPHIQRECTARLFFVGIDAAAAFQTADTPADVLDFYRQWYRQAGWDCEGYQDEAGIPALGCRSPPITVRGRDNIIMLNNEISVQTRLLLFGGTKVTIWKSTAYWDLG